MKEGWEYISLKDIGKIASGKSIQSSEIQDKISEGLFPCYGGNGIRGYVSKYQYDGKYPIIGRVGALCGNVHLTDGKFYPTEHALVMSLKRKDSPKFIEYLLKSMNLSQYAKGVAQPVISAGTLSDLKVSIPPLPEQERIVAELDLLTGIIDKQKQQLKELDTLAQSIFYNMFGDPVKNEKGWKKHLLGEVCGFVSGFAFRSESFKKEGLPVLRISNIQNDTIEEEDMVYFSPSDYKEDFRKYEVNNGDIVIAMSGATTGKLGVHRGVKSYYLNQRVGKFNIMDKSKLNNAFLFFFLKTISATILNDSMGVAQPNISSKQIQGYYIPLPPVEIQEFFAKEIHSIESQKESINRSIEESQNLFDYTMDKYFG